MKIYERQNALDNDKLNLDFGNWLSTLDHDNLRGRVVYVKDIVQCYCFSLSLGLSKSDSIQFAQKLKGSFEVDQVLWDSWVQEMEQIMFPIDEIMSKFLKKSNTFDDTFIVRNWRKYKSVLKRALVQQKLSLERKEIQKNILLNISTVEQKLNFPEQICDKIVNIRIMEESIRSNDEIAFFAIDDSKYHDLKQSALHLLQETEKCLITEWQQSCKYEIPNQVLHLDKELKVMYPDSLGLFLHDVRNLLGLGCKLQQKTIQMATEATKIFKTVLKLRQIAHLFNQLDKKIFWFHKPILNIKINAFKETVHSLSWRNSNLTELTESATQLEKTNQNLQQMHEQILKKIKSLVYAPWQPTINEINMVFQQFSEEQVRDWKMHCQMQLFKIMDKNYSKILMEPIPEIQIEAFVRHGILCLRPPLEEIKKIYFDHLKVVIASPKLKGFIDYSPLEVVAKHMQKVHKVYKKSMCLFTDFCKILDNYQKMIIICPSDKIESMCQKDIFEDISQRKTEAQLISNVLKFENLSCSLVLFKSAVEGYLQKLEESVIDFLKQSIEALEQKIQKHSQNVEEICSKTFVSASEAFNAKNKLDDLAKVDLQQTILELQQKQVMLQQPTTIMNLEKHFQEFDLRFKEQCIVFSSQIPQRVGKIEAKASDLNKVSLENDIDEFFILVAELDVEATNLMKDADLLGIKVEFKVLDELKFIIKQELESKQIIQEFKKRMDHLLQRKIVEVDPSDLVYECKTKSKKMQKMLSALDFLHSEWPRLFLEIKKFGVQHWSELCILLNIPVSRNLILNDLIQNYETLKSQQQKIFELNLKAKNEYIAVELIQETELWLESLRFTLLPYLDYFVVSDCKHLFVQIREQLVSVSSVVQNVPNETLCFFEQRLMKLDSLLSIFWNLQKKIVYITPVSHALPNQMQQKFLETTKTFKSLVSQINSDSRVLVILKFQPLNPLVLFLEQCQKALEDFFEQMRTKFPKFYFLADEDLLEILSNPAKIETHLGKLFNGIKSLEIQNNMITGIISSEKIKLSNPVPISGELDWLQLLSVEIKKTLRMSLDNLVSGKQGDYPEQIKNLFYRIEMTAKIEAAIKTQKLSDLKFSLQNYDSIYYSRIVSNLLEKNIQKIDDFEWKKIVRFYYNKKCIICVFDSEFEYSFEFQTHAPIVQSPLTDSCFTALVHAMADGLGGCLYGPAGTGKTESIKHLGYMFGRQVLVFNCDEALNTTSITRLFKGVIQCGAWGCFDEFNRLSNDVLAAVSNLLFKIQNSLRLKINFDDFNVDFNAAIFVTLNPAGKAYGGRQKLPDNLKQLFRNISMSFPDLEYICETELQTKGFRVGFGALVVDFFSSCKSLMSLQCHYDWGLRALKTLVCSAGTLKLNNESSDEDILVCALKSTVLGKLTMQDKKKFHQMLSSYFCSTEPQILSNLEFSHFGLELTNWQREAIVYLKEACTQRMGVCIVGPKNSGKMTLCRLLAHFQKAKILVQNPKAVDRTFLLGYMDNVTNEWQDGILTKFARKSLNHDGHLFIILDGDIDPEWIEALNSVLDDNRMLTLPNGERIKFLGNVNFVFLTDSLEHASPATVSRLGIVFIDQYFEPKRNCVLFVGKKINGVPIQLTMASNSQNIIDAILEQSTVSSGVLVPKQGNALNICFVDLDLPRPDKYSCIQAHQFIHQLIKQKGFHHPDTKKWVSCSCLEISATCSSTKNICSRFLSKFEINKLEKKTKQEQWAETIDSILESGFDIKEATKICTVLTNCFEHHENLLLHMNWARGLTKGGLDVPTLVFQIGCLVLPNLREEISKQVRKEFGDFCEFLISPKNSNLESTAQMTNISELIQTFFCSGLKVLHVASNFVNPVLECLIQNTKNSMFIKKISFREASMGSFYAQLKVVLYNAGVINVLSCLVFDSCISSGLSYYQTLHKLFCQSSLEYLPDFSELEPEYQKVQPGCSFTDFFLKRVRKNIKIVILNMDPQIMNGFPMFNNLKGNIIFTELDQDCLNQVCKPLGDQLSNIFKSQKSSPRELVHIVHLFEKLQSEQTKTLQQRRDFLSNGLQKLFETKKTVDSLSSVAKQQEIELQEKQHSADETLKSITTTILDVSTQKGEMQSLSVQLEKEEILLNAKKEQIQSELSGVEPLLFMAKKAVSEIKSENLNEVRSLRAPPATVRDVLEGVLRLLGQQDMSWSAMKIVLGKKTFKDDVLNFDARKITATIQQQVESLLQQKKESFIEANARKGSIAAAPLAAWVTANLEYSKVFVKVDPLQQSLNECNKKITNSRARINELQNLVSSVDQRVLELKTQFAEKTGEAQRLDANLEKTRLTLIKANQFLASLSSEEKRWETDLRQIEAKLQQVDEFCLCCALYATFCGPLNQESRLNICSIWTKELNLENFCFLNEKNDLSRENVMISLLTTEITYWVADGNGTGLEHIKSIDAKVISIKNETCFKEMEMAIRLGHSVILMDVDHTEIQPWLFPIIRREFYNVNGIRYIDIAQKQTEIHGSFRLILYSCFSGWKLPESIVGYVVQLCWSTTTLQLQERMLQIITEADIPDVIHRIKTLESGNFVLKQQLNASETQILEQLNSSDGSVLCNDTLLNTLIDSKQKSESILASLTESKQVAKNLKQNQNAYLSIISNLVNVYFLIRTLPLIDENARYNLQTFLEWFQDALNENNVGKDALDEYKLKNIEKTMLCIVFEHLCFGSQEKFHVGFGIALLCASKHVSVREIEELCDVSLEIKLPDYTFPAWVPQSRRKKLLRILEFVNLQCLHENNNSWDQWLSGSKNMPFTGTCLQKALICAALIPEKQFQCLHELCYSFFKVTSKNLNEIVLKSKKPVLIFVSPGANVVRELSCYCTVMSLGQGQTAAASDAFIESIKTKKVLVIQNLQASPEFVQEFISLVRKFPGTNFNIVVTCEPRVLPVELVELCTLFYLQSPQGFMRNLELLLQQCPKAESTRQMQLQFLVSWHHTVVQERSHFVPQAWSSQYEFGNSEFQSCLKVTDRNIIFCKGILELIYGGKIDGLIDSDVEKAIIKNVINEEYLGVNGRMPSRSLVRGFTIPQSETAFDFIESIRSIQADESLLLQLPANVNLAMESFKASQVSLILNTLVFKAQESKVLQNESQSTENIKPITTDYQSHVAKHLKNVYNNLKLCTQAKNLKNLIELFETAYPNMPDSINLDIPEPAALLTMIKLSNTQSAHKKKLYAFFSKKESSFRLDSVFIQGVILESSRIATVTATTSPMVECTIYLKYMAEDSPFSLNVPIYTDSTRSNLIAVVRVHSEFTLDPLVYTSGVAIFVK